MGYDPLQAIHMKSRRGQRLSKQDLDACLRSAGVTARSRNEAYTREHQTTIAARHTALCRLGVDPIEAIGMAERGELPPVTSRPLHTMASKSTPGQQLPAEVERALSVGHAPDDEVAERARVLYETCRGECSYVDALCAVTGDEEMRRRIARIIAAQKGQAA